jgi:hypothetical protein
LVIARFCRLIRKTRIKPTENQQPGSADLIAAHRQIVERAHERGLKIYGATLTPFEGANYFTVEGEAKRKVLNEWIRTRGLMMPFSISMSQSVIPRIRSDYRFVLIPAIICI